MKKYRVFGIIPIIMFIFLLLGIFAFLWFYFDSTEDEKTRLIIPLIIMLIFLPLGLFIWSFITMWACIEFDETGVSKTLIGIKIRYIKWEDVKDFKLVSSNGGFTQWLFISKVPLKNYSLTRCRLRRDNVYLMSNEEVINSIKKIAPKDIKINDIY